MTTTDEYLRDDPGNPLGKGYPLGRTLREDGESHREAWMRVLRADPCSYCGGPAGTVDHIEPQCRRASGLGGAHSWMNYCGACQRCNGRKSARSLLHVLVIGGVRDLPRAA